METFKQIGVSENLIKALAEMKITNPTEIQEKAIPFLLKNTSDFMGEPLPVVLALFGGYRDDDYNAVLDLHTKSLINCSNIICNNKYVDKLIIPNKHKQFNY